MIRFGTHEPRPARWAPIALEDWALWEAIRESYLAAPVRESPLPVAEWLAREAARDAEITAWVRADVVQGDLFA